MFKKFSDIINEGFTNLFSEQQKHPYADLVWGLLHKAYASQGGIKGSGFDSKEDMIKNIPFWKVATRGGEVKAVALYKDRNGRKRVAIATDGTPEGKELLLEMMIEDIKTGRSYVELSGLSLKFLSKNFNVANYAVNVHTVKNKLKEDIRDVPADDPELKSHPNLKQYFYQRKISDHWHTKIMLGNINAELIKNLI